MKPKLLVIACVVGLAACSNQVTPSPAPLVSRQCPADGAGLGYGAHGVVTGSLPENFVADHVIRCTAELIQATKRLKVTEWRLASPAPVLQLLTLRDDPPSRACPANAPIEPYIVLVDSDSHAYAPRLPQDQCQGVKQEVLTAIEGIDWTLVRTYEVDAPR